jgi:hypothetical protein
MDNRHTNNSQLDLTLFSRGNTPPVQGPVNQPQSSYTQSMSGINSPPASQIDSLFQNLSPASEPISSIQQRYQQQTGQDTASEPYGNNSAPTTPSMSLIDHEPANASRVNTNTTNAERQSALLSLLGGAPQPPSTNARQAQPQQQTQQGSLPQQVPTPPGSSQRSDNSPAHNEAQGKFLLEQLMGG